MADDGGRAAAPFPNGPETAGRAPDGRFVAGGPGGPGRPRGSRHRAQAALDAIGEAGAAAVLQAVVAAAKGGDMRAASILLDRIWPARKGRAVEVALPPMESAADLVPALAAVVAAMARGELTPEEARAMCVVLEIQRRAIETAELEARVAALEECVRAAGVRSGAVSRRALDARLGRVAARLAGAGGLGLPPGPVEGWPEAELHRLGCMVEAGGAVQRAAWARLSDADLEWVSAFWLAEADAERTRAGGGADR